MSGNIATLINVDRGEYGAITVDLDLLRGQLKWLAGLDLDYASEEAQDHQDGIMNLLEGILDMADPPEDEEDCTEDTENVFVVGGTP